MVDAWLYKKCVVLFFFFTLQPQKQQQQQPKDLSPSHSTAFVKLETKQNEN